MSRFGDFRGDNDNRQTDRQTPVHARGVIIQYVHSMTLALCKLRSNHRLYRDTMPLIKVSVNSGGGGRHPAGFHADYLSSLHVLFGHNETNHRIENEKPVG